MAAPLPGMVIVVDKLFIRDVDIVEGETELGGALVTCNACLFVHCDIIELINKKKLILLCYNYG